MTRPKTNPGNFFEDFALGQVIRHATPRTLSTADSALYMALYGPRFAIQSSREFARAVGYSDAPLDDLLVFHVVFGKTVPDISLNAVANLGYAECRFVRAVFAGDTLSATSRVIGLKENSSRETGVVWVRTEGHNQRGEVVLEYVRWVMVRKRDKAHPAPPDSTPRLGERVAPESLASAVPRIPAGSWDGALAGSPFAFEDYAVGERIDHVDGMTIEEAEHQLATRLYQNTAKVHFNAHTERQGRNGRRLVYGGVVMSLARALSFNGLANAFHVAAVNAGRHVAPCFADDTIYAWSEVLECAELPSRGDVGALRVRTVGLKNESAGSTPRMGPDGKYMAAVVLDIDLWLIVPRRRSMI